MRAGLMAVLAGGAAPTGYLNFSKRYLPRWRAAAAGVRSGQAFAKVAFVGSSYTAGQGAGSSTSNLTGARQGSFPTALAALLAAVIPTTDDSLFGTGGSSYLAANYDSRLVAGSGWGNDVVTTGGNVITNTTTTNSLAFTPTRSFDTIDIIYIQASNKGTFSVNVDGGAAIATINANGSTSLQKTTASCALGTHTINIQRTGVGNGVSIIAVDAYTSGTKQVHLWNMGWSGSAVSDWIGAGSVWSPLNALAFVAPDLSIIDLSSVEETAGLNLATYRSNLDTLLAVLKVSGDVILNVTRPINGVAQSVLDSYTSFLRGYAKANKYPLFDQASLWGNFTQANASGYMFDSLHSTVAGYANEAAICKRLLDLGL